MWEYNHTDELYHHGILGMKWGHRKSKSDTMYKELKRYRKLEKTEKKKQAFNKAEVERYKKADTRMKKMGVNKYRRLQKASRVGNATAAAFTANFTIGALRSTAQFAKQKKTGQAICSAFLTGAGAWATREYIKGNREARRNINQANEYEYNQYQKKYSKVK